MEVYNDEIQKERIDQRRQKKALILLKGSDEEKSESDNGLGEIAKSLALLSKHFDNRFGKKIPSTSGTKRNSRNHDHQKPNDGSSDKRDEENQESRGTLLLIASQR
ncbi:hypothetical protein L1987_18144 [Smallanthus sonchifolius]|uniref:Uncharacterized protein n=1 Tax=Smallanthus sonchifolius TaxID=185202 RepID=A0ACB9J008_9ASTR|nr:hypothetical protein L1987_18144 [Smallanthus sonchifolius]